MSEVKVEGEIKYEVWITCPSAGCGYYFDLCDTKQWRASVFELADEILDTDPDPEIENCSIDIQCPECKCDLVLSRTHY